MSDIKHNNDELVSINKKLLVKLLEILNQIIDSDYAYIEAKPIVWEEGLIIKEKIYGYQLNGIYDDNEEIMKFKSDEKARMFNEMGRRGWKLISPASSQYRGSYFFEKRYNHELLQALNEIILSISKS